MKKFLLVSALIFGLAAPHSALAGDDAVAAIIGGVVGYHIGKHHGRERDREPRYYPERYPYRKALRFCEERAPYRYPQYYRHMKRCMADFDYAWYDPEEREYYRDR
jgi:hypothetical protein